jgi:hypothetical protein
MVEPNGMVDEATAEKACNVAKCKCVATAPRCPKPQQRGGFPRRSTTSSVRAAQPSMFRDELVDGAYALLGAGM